MFAVKWTRYPGSIDVCSAFHSINDRKQGSFGLTLDQTEMKFIVFTIRFSRDGKSRIMNLTNIGIFRIYRLG